MRIVVRWLREGIDASASLPPVSVGPSVRRRANPQLPSKASRTPKAELEPVLDRRRLDFGLEINRTTIAVLAAASATIVGLLMYSGSMWRGHASPALPPNACQQRADQTARSGARIGSTDGVAGMLKSSPLGHIQPTWLQSSPDTASSHPAGTCNGSVSK
jgi:hypothetical protein